MRENGVFGSEAVLDGKNSVDSGEGCWECGMGPSDVEWLNVDRRMAKRNKIKTLISTQMIEAIRFINVTPPQTVRERHFETYHCFEGI